MAKAKLLYFTAFLCVVIAFVFHTTAMGHHHWKRATYRENTSLGFNVTTIGLFTRCTPSEVNKVEACIPNLYSSGESCYLQGSCLPRNVSNPCHCDFLPSTKGIAACAIIAAIGLGLAVLLLFLQSINDSESRLLALVFGVFPLILLALAFIFILIALILVGSYLSRDMMYLARVNESKSHCVARAFLSILFASSSGGSARPSRTSGQFLRRENRLGLGIGNHRPSDDLFLSDRLLDFHLDPALITPQGLFLDFT